MNVKVPPLPGLTIALQASKPTSDSSQARAVTTKRHNLILNRITEIHVGEKSHTLVPQLGTVGRRRCLSTAEPVSVVIEMSSLARMQHLKRAALDIFAIGTSMGVNGGDANDCQTALTACKTIGHAISLASPGDSIIVAAATYTENLNIGFSLNVIGSGANTTIIDGGGVNRIANAARSPWLHRDNN